MTERQPPPDNPVVGTLRRADAADGADVLASMPADAAAGMAESLDPR